MMKKSSSTASLPRISSTLSICSLPRTNSSSSLGRKGSFEDLLNYASFFDDSCLNADSSLNTPSTVLVPNSSLIVDGCADLPSDELTSSASTLTKAALKEHNEQLEKLEDVETFDFELLQRKIKNMPNVKQTSTRTCHSKPELSIQNTEDEVVDNTEPEEFIDEEVKATEVTQISITGGEDGGPKKISFGAYGEFTIIDGVMYNNRGYEICGHLNQHNRPCQRIGKCPFHSKNKKQNIEKLLKLTEQHSTSAPQISITPTVQSLAPPSSTSSSSQSAEKKKHQPMKKTPYKQGWSKEEHFRFLTGLEIHGKGAWKDIAMIVGSRTPTQIQSHAQKYYLRQKQKIKNKRSIHDFTLEDLKKALAQNGASISINTAGSSSIPEDESESSDEFIENEPKRSKKPQAETKSSVTVSPNSQLRTQAPVSSLPTNNGLTASIQQALDWTKNVAAYLSALQAVQGQQQKPGTPTSNNNMMSYSMLGNMLMANPLLMQQQQLQSMVQQAQQPAEEFLTPQSDMSVGLPRNPSLQSLNFEPLYSFEQTAFDHQASTADLMDVFEQPQDLTSSHSLFSPIKTEKMKRRLSETSLPAEHLEDESDLAPPAKIRRH